MGRNRLFGEDRRHGLMCWAEALALNYEALPRVTVLGDSVPAARLADIQQCQGALLGAIPLSAGELEARLGRWPGNLW